MRSYRDLVRLILLVLLLSQAFSCARTRTQLVQPPEGPYFVTSEMTYLLDAPSSRGHVISPLYRGDDLDLVDGRDSTWWRVKLQRTGETGWVRKELLSLTKVDSVFYYVKEDTFPLLECPRSDCITIMLLFRGDQVQRVQAGCHGWWRVLAIKGRSLGWVPASALTEDRKEALKQPRQPYYYVAIRKLILRARPSASGEVIRILEFNDQVKKLAASKDWFKVRQPSTGAVGWVASRYLETLPLFSPRGVPASNKLRPFRQREEPLSEPEFM
jgi:SH3-like domain-containing protein